MTSLLVPLITIPPVAPELLCLPLMPGGCEAATDASRSFRCVLERGLSGENSAPAANFGLVEAETAGAPEAAAQDFPVLYQSEGAVVAETPQQHVFAFGQITKDLEVASGRRSGLRRGGPELPERGQEEPEQRAQFPDASTTAALPTEVVELKPLPELSLSTAPEQTLPEPQARVDAPPAEPGQPLRPVRKVPDLAFRLLLRPEQPERAGETAPAKFPQDEPASAATRTPARPENTFGTHETEIPAPTGVTPKGLDRRPRPETPDIVRETGPVPRLVAAVGRSKSVSTEAGEAERAQIKEVPVPHLRVTEGEAAPLQEQPGIPPEQPTRAHGMAAAHEGGLPPKDEPRAAPASSRTDRTLPSNDQAVQPAPARHMFVRVDRAGARPVEIGLTEKAGRVEVSVRSADDGLNRALRENLGDLVGRLREEGFEAASWTPREVICSGPAEPGANERGAAEDRESAREPFEQPDEQRQRRRPAEPWLEVLDAEGDRQGGKR